MSNKIDDFGYQKQIQEALNVDAPSTSTAHLSTSSSPREKTPSVYWKLTLSSLVLGLVPQLFLGNAHVDLAALKGGNFLEGSLNVFRHRKRDVAKASTCLTP